MARIVLQSPLDPVALATKMRDVLGDRDAKPKPGVTGQGSEQDMTLYVYRSGSSAMTKFDATMDAAGSGTRIEGKFGIGRGLVLALAMWCGFLAMFLAIGLSVVAGGGPLGVGIPFILIPSAMIAIPFLLFWSGTRTNQQDQAAILAFLAETVEARPA